MKKVKKKILDSAREVTDADLTQLKELKKSKEETPLMKASRYLGLIATCKREKDNSSELFKATVEANTLCKDMVHRFVANDLEMPLKVLQYASKSLNQQQFDKASFHCKEMIEFLSKK